MLTEQARTEVRAKLAALQAEHGSLANLKADEQYRIAYPDAVDLHDWRMEWNRARHSEQPAPPADPPAAAAEPAVVAEAPRRKPTKKEAAAE